MRAVIGGRLFDWERGGYLMGIVNTTPDSFSGDGFARDVEAAVARGLRMVAEGADVIDVGGESTRPAHTYGAGAAVPVAAEEEIERVVPVVSRLAQAAGVPISIDTSKEPVARAAVEAGASIVNDVWGLARSPGIATLAAERGLGLVVMHNQEGTGYGDLMADIIAALRRSAGAALAAGVPAERILIDPGLGFGKDWRQSLEVLRRLREFAALEHPLLVGPSRKGFIGQVLDAPVADRLEGTAATVVAAILRGAAMVRVHDVREMARVARMARELR